MISLAEAFLTLKNDREVASFLKDLCTPQEIKAMNERWQVCQLLAEGKVSYRSIHEKTKSSLATISRVARFLKDESYGGYKLVLHRQACQKQVPSWHQEENKGGEQRRWARCGILQPEDGRKSLDTPRRKSPMP